jgi:hypothetical protein
VKWKRAVASAVEINATVSELKRGKRRRGEVNSVGEIMKMGQRFIFFFHRAREGGRWCRATTVAGDVAAWSGGRGRVGLATWATYGGIQGKGSRPQRETGPKVRMGYGRMFLNLFRI